MARLDIETFKGEMPRLSQRLLPVENASSCLNCLFDAGDLEGWPDVSQITAAIIANTRSLYLYDRIHWFSWNNWTSAIASPVAQDQYDRVYFTNDSGPRVTSNLIGVGAGLKPSASYSLGVPAPTAAPTIAINNPGSDTSGDISDDETRIYVYTYVTEYGEEGASSPASNSVTLNSADGTIDVTVPVLGTNTANVTHKNIYRSAATSEDTDLFFVAQIPLAQTSFTDTLAGTALGGVLSTADFQPPPAEMRGLVMMANGMAAGFVDNEIFISEPYLPYAYPLNYRRTTEHKIVAMAATATGLVIGTEGYPYILSGINPENVSQTKIEERQACVSQQSMVDMGRYVIYASPDGLVAASEGGVELLTRNIFDKRTWSDYQPETIHAYFHEDKYFGFYGDANNSGVGVGGFYYDMLTGDFCPLSIYAQAAFSDLLNDELYLVIGDQLHQWRGSSSTQSYTWRSKLFQLKDTAFTCAKIWCDDVSSVGLKVFTDGVETYTLASLPDNNIRLPDECRGREWQIELSGTSRVEKITLATSRAEL